MSPIAIVYQCGDVSVSIDRGDPINRASNSLLTTVVVTRRECVRYERGACVQWREFQDEEQARRSGRLRVTRAS
ncbi:MAG: hypothetical protein WD801_14925 [Gemmatimonadaceae bacterium]